MSKRKLGIAEMLKMINDLPDPAARLYSLRTCKDITPLVAILQYTFHPDIKSLLPKGSPPYKENQYMDQHSNLYHEFRKMYIFMHLPNSTAMPNLKREQLFIAFLENIDKEDAKLILAMKDKKKPYPNITYELVYHAFPNVLPTPTENIELEYMSDDEKEVTKNEKVEKNLDLERACPFGCRTRTGKVFMMPGPLVKHLRTAHKFTDEEVQQFKQEQY